MIPSSNSGKLSDRQAWFLALLLRACGLIDCLALIVALMPAVWIASLHTHLDIGPFPSDTITHYFARSSSLMYAVHGILLIFVSFDINRYLSIIKLLAVIAIIHGLILIGIDANTGMPWWWTATEGPLLIAWGTLVLFTTFSPPQNETGFRPKGPG